MSKPGEPRRPTRQMLERLHYIDAALRRGEPITCATLHDVFGIKRKAAWRDFEDLKNRGRPVDFDSQRNTYYYTEAVEPLPDEVITEGELFSLMVARTALEQYRGTPYYAGLNRSYEKLARGLTAKVAFSAADYAARISFKGVGTPKIDPAIFRTVSQAIARCRRVTFDYRKPEESTPRRRTAELWHVTSRGGMWYAIGHDVEACSRRTFSLTRISKPVLTARKFQVPRDFSVDQHFAHAFSVLGGAGDHRIVVRFHGATAVRVQEWEWHESERWRDLGGGCVELELRLAAFEEIERWVFSWGREVEVVGPPELRERVAAGARAIAAVYGGAHAPSPVVAGRELRAAVES